MDQDKSSDRIEIQMTDKETSHPNDVTVSQTIWSDVQPVVILMKDETMESKLFSGDRQRRLIIGRMSAENRSHDGCWRSPCGKLLCCIGKQKHGIVLLVF